MRTHEQAVAAFTYLRPSAIAERLDVSRSHVVELIRTGKLAAINISIGQRPEYRVHPDELDAFLERQKVAA